MPEFRSEGEGAYSVRVNNYSSVKGLVKAEKRAASRIDT
jgi:hypothetical protein